MERELDAWQKRRLADLVYMKRVGDCDCELVVCDNPYGIVLKDDGFVEWQGYRVSIWDLWQHRKGDNEPILNPEAYNRLMNCGCSTEK